MRSRYPMSRPARWPEVWLFAEPRIVDLRAAVARLPRGAGVVVGFAGRPASERRQIFDALVTTARGRLIVVDALDRRIAKAHDRAELVAARRCGAELVFVSPLFATRSHPGAPTLGRVKFGLVVRRAGVAVAALGGMDARRFRSVRSLGAVAWGAIDALA